jgi:hypothetical protein
MARKIPRDPAAQVQIAPLPSVQQKKTKLVGAKKIAGKGFYKT